MAKWIEFVEVPFTGKTKRFTVRSLGGGGELGTVGFYPRWRKYSFFPNPNTLYESDCMRDIAQFCEEQTQAWRKP